MPNILTEVNFVTSGRTESRNKADI